jgi:23S rRNA (adenine2030-N6)-methyltransferase
MNYRHTFHAGNFADVLKHALLCWTIRYLQQKEAPLALIDTHAGRGVYDLTGDEAAKTGEAQNGILRLLARTGIPAVFTPYVDQARDPRRYPGSTMLMLALARPTDRIVATELHPAEAQALKGAALPGQAQILLGDGYASLLKQIPPREKRGLVLIDPPFETDDEFERLAKTFIAAHRKWPTGVYIVWFPIKHETDVTRFTSELTNAAIPKLTLVTLDVARAEGLSRTGLLLCNAPFTLETEWHAPLVWLAETLAQGPHPSGVIAALSA